MDNRWCLISLPQFSVTTEFIITMTRGTATFLSLLCLLILFTETFAPVCEPEIFRSEFDDSYDSFPDSLEPDDCVWSEWGFWSVCSHGVRSRYRTKESFTWRCRCGGPYVQTKSCSNIVHQPGEVLNLRSSSFNFRPNEQAGLDSGLGFGLDSGLNILLIR